jgi:hypothetical protein
VELISNQPQDAKAFVAPTKPEDFPQGETRIEHTYENGNKVVFLLLTSGKIARIREGSGRDAEVAEVEAGADHHKVIASMISATVTIDGKSYNMFEFSEKLKLKDYLNIKKEFAELNF